MCLFPVTHRNPYTGKLVTHSCGKCVDCVRRYQQDWTFRLEKEYADWSRAYFLTLTYNNHSMPFLPLPDDVDLHALSSSISNLRSTRYLISLRSSLNESSVYVSPDNIAPGIPVPTVCKSDVQSYFKVLRERWALSHNGERLRFKYFLCSEYGPNTLRPHYHVIVFVNIGVRDFARYFCDTWRELYGNVYWKFRPIKAFRRNGVGDVMSYVSKYCCKPAALDNPYVTAGVVAKPFRLVSKGIGYSYFERFKRNLDSVLSRLTVYTDKYMQALDDAFLTFRNGYIYRLPRYYIDKFFPQKLYPSKCYDKSTGQFKVVWQRRKDSESLLCQIYSTFVQVRFFQRERQALEEVALSLSPRPGLETYASAEVILRQNRLAALKERAQRLFSSYDKQSSLYSY